MMYKEKLAVAIKTAGRVLRENRELVYLPFGAEYSVFIKNLNTVRALVKVSIDGDDVGDGLGFIIGPTTSTNNSLNIERFIKGGNLNEGNRFKFIERTKQIEDHKGIGIEDGIVRVEFNFEHKIHRVRPLVSNEWQWDDPTHPYNFGGDLKRSATYDIHSTSSNSVSGPTMDSYSADVQNDAGITVPGSVSDQHFVEGEYFPTEAETHVMVLKLVGETEDNRRVQHPVTVKTKKKCVTCGTKNRLMAKFCSNCGTSLNIL